MIFADLSRQLMNICRCQGIVSALNAGLKEECGICSHFMMVGIDVWSPFVKCGNTSDRFRVLEHNIITVQVEPVMVGPAPGPVFTELPGICIRIVVQAFCEIDPCGMTLHAVWVECRIYQDDGIFQKF